MKPKYDYYELAYKYVDEEAFFDGDELFRREEDAISRINEILEEDDPDLEYIDLYGFNVDDNNCGYPEEFIKRYYPNRKPNDLTEALPEDEDEEEYLEGVFTIGIKENNTPGVNMLGDEIYDDEDLCVEKIKRLLDNYAGDDSLEYIALYRIDLINGFNAGEELIRRYYPGDIIDESLNENYIPNETYTGTDEEYEELSDIIFDRCKDPNTNRISLIISDIDNVDYYDLTLSVPEYIYDNYEGWEFGGELLDDLAEFLDKSINQITQQDVNTFDVDKFLEFLSDKYRDNIIEEMLDDVAFMDNAYDDKFDSLQGEANESDWDDRY